MSNFTLTAVDVRKLIQPSRYCKVPFEIETTEPEEEKKIDLMRHRLPKRKQLIQNFPQRIYNL